MPNGKISLSSIRQGLVVIDVPETRRVHASGSDRRVIPATCTTHGGTPGFTNLVISKRDGDIVLDPHVTGQCVLTLNEDAARDLHEVFGEWLG